MSVSQSRRRPLEERFAGLPVSELDGGRLVIEAATHRAKRRGLMALDALAPEHALRIPKCPSVHTFRMRFGLDLIWLAGDGSVVRIDRDVPPRRTRLCPRASSVIETVAGEANAFLEAGVGRADHDRAGTAAA
jgi:hypothetical protein